jgi:hypothetical protein
MNSQLPKKILNFFKQHWIWIVGVLAGIFYGLITRWGAIVGFDSYYYLASAQGIKDGLGIGWMGGDGVFVPLSHYPPIYPLVVAFISFISGTTILHAARIIAILAVTIAVVCTGYMVYCQTRCWFFTVLGMALFIIPGSFSVTLISAMSEGLFLALLCGFLLTLVDCCDLKSNLRTGIQVVLIAAMILVRFAAVTVLAAYLIALVLDERYRLVNRIKVALLAGLGAILPLGIWLWSRTGIGEVTGRSLLFHPPGETQIRLAWETIQAWFVPEWNKLAVPSLAKVGLIIIVAGVVVFVIRALRNPVMKTEKKESSRLTRFLGIYLLVYPVFLWVSFTLMDASTRWTTRILSPWLFCLMLWLVISFSKFVLLTRSRVVKGLLLAGLVTWGGAQLLNSANQAWTLFAEGDGFTARVYQQSELIENIHRMDKTVKVYTNNTSVIYFNTGKLSWSIPEKMDTIQSKPNVNYEQEMEAMQADIRSGKAILVIFRPYDDKNGVYPQIEELTGELSQTYKSKVGSIYK